jgi:hypothetical protein
LCGTVESNPASAICPSTLHRFIIAVGVERCVLTNYLYCSGLSLTNKTPHTLMLELARNSFQLERFLAKGTPTRHPAIAKWQFAEGSRRARCFYLQCSSPTGRPRGEQLAREGAAAQDHRPNPRLNRPLLRTNQRLTTLVPPVQRVEALRCCPSQPYSNIVPAPTTAPRRPN